MSPSRSRGWGIVFAAAAATACLHCSCGRTPGGGAARTGGSGEAEASLARDGDGRACAACPACAASVRCPEGAELVCGQEPYSPFGCARPDGVRQGPWKEFEWLEDHWIETDGWNVDGRPEGDWVSRDATGRIVRVSRWDRGRLAAVQWVCVERSEELEEGRVDGWLDPGCGSPPAQEGRVQGQVLGYSAYCSLDTDGWEIVGAGSAPFVPPKGLQIPHGGFSLCNEAE